MAEDVEGEDGESQEPPKKRLSGKRIVLFFVVPLLLLIGILAGLFMAGVFDPLLESDESSEEQTEREEPRIEEVGEAQFYEMENILVVLSGGDQETYLSLDLALQVHNENAMSELERLEPRISDEFQSYLRELRVEDIEGSQGMYRLREELLRRVNLATEEADVRDVVVREMLLQ